MISKIRHKNETSSELYLKGSGMNTERDAMDHAIKQP
jgi:hypothetical protein